MRQDDPVVFELNTRWAMDFMHDTPADQLRIRIFALVGECTRECVTLHVARSFSGTDVAAFLTQAGQRRRKPSEVVQCDKGTKFTAIAHDNWVYWNRVQLDFNRPRMTYDVIDRRGNRVGVLQLGVDEVILGFGNASVIIGFSNADGLQGVRVHAWPDAIR